jgi:protease-4
VRGIPSTHDGFCPPPGGLDNPLGPVPNDGIHHPRFGVYLKERMDKLGIEPEFPGRGDYKTARFLYTERDFTPAHREMMGWLLDSLMQQMVGDIAASRDLTPEKVRELFNEFQLCPICDRVYWRGSHYEKMEKFIEGVMEEEQKRASF